MHTPNWESDYPWGDATFHYGRWFKVDGYVWVWKPGYEWGPAWVTWCHADAEGFCGWAPLPPEAEFLAGVGLTWQGHPALDVEFGLNADAYVFIGADHLWESDYYPYLYGGDHAAYLYTRSAIHNGYHFSDDRFQFDGVGRDRLRTFTRRDDRVEVASNVQTRENGRVVALDRRTDRSQ